MNQPQRRPVVLCADDYAIAPGVSRAILDLLDRGRISATSCLSVSPSWPEHGIRLRPYADRADIGLHLALTDFAPLGAMPRLAPAGRLPSLGRLMALALARRLDEQEIAAEIDRQVRRFAGAFGRAPDFIDGHQHVHQLPTVRDAVTACVRTLRPAAYLRICDEPAGAVLRRGLAVGRALAISRLGRGLRRRASRLGIAANRRFAGVRDFNESLPYRALFQRFIAPTDGLLLVMCHPGLVDPELAAVDPITAPREDEYRYFAGETFPADLAEANVALARLTRADAPGRSSARD